MPVAAETVVLPSICHRRAGDSETSYETVACGFADERSDHPVYKYRRHSSRDGVVGSGLRDNYRCEGRESEVGMYSRTGRLYPPR
jgi:hypothetical protein